MPERNEVLYRRWRPQRFDQVAGQDHVSHTIRQAVRTGRVAHAYLLCGPRGTGKTSTARILAKALNCLDRRDGEPCGGCENCVAVNENRMLDLVEIDAASNRGIDNIRDLRDKARFAPGAGEYKVYVIDEVHQLSGDAFNALLKTLEEPPPHVIFVLATTEAHRVPATILSRCQRFDFRRLSNDVVVDKLAEIAGEEEIDAEPAVLSMIARAAYGSLRDAENLLDQLSVSYGSEITVDQASELLGLGNYESSSELAVATLRGDVKESLEIINREAARGSDLARLRDGAIDVLRAGLLVKAGVEDALSHSQESLDVMAEAGRGVSLEKLLHIVMELEKADFRQNPSSPLPLEVAVLNALAVPQPASAPAETAPAAPPRPAARPPVEAPPRTRQPEERSAPAAVAPQAAPAPARERGGTPARRLRSPQDDRWTQVIKSLSRTNGTRFNLGALLRDVEDVEVDGESLRLSFRNGSMAQRMSDELADPSARAAVESSVEQAYAVKLKIAIGGGEGGRAGRQGRGSAMDSPLVRAAVTMGARIVDEGDAPRRGEDGPGGRPTGGGQDQPAAGE